jgi:hypothetical protein
MRPVGPILATAVAGALAAGSFFAGRIWATRDVASPLKAQAAQLDELRGSVDELGRSLSLLAMMRATAAPPPPCPEAWPAPVQPPPIDGSRASATAPVAPPPRPEEEASINSAEGMFAKATSRGHWTAEDEEALRQLRNEAPGADWRPFMQKLASAINAGRLRPTPVEPL